LRNAANIAAATHGGDGEGKRNNRGKKGNKKTRTAGIRPNVSAVRHQRKSTQTCNNGQRGREKDPHPVEIEILARGGHQNVSRTTKKAKWFESGLGKETQGTQRLLGGCPPNPPEQHFTRKSKYLHE